MAGDRVADRQSIAALATNCILKAAGHPSAISENSKQIRSPRAFVRGDVFSFHAIMEIAAPARAARLRCLSNCAFVRSLIVLDAWAKKTTNEIALRERKAVSQDDQCTTGEASL